MFVLAVAASDLARDLIYGYHGPAYRHCFIQDGLNLSPLKPGLKIKSQIYGNSGLNNMD